MGTIDWNRPKTVQTIFLTKIEVFSVPEVTYNCPSYNPSQLKIEILSSESHGNPSGVFGLTSYCIRMYYR